MRDMDLAEPHARDGENGLLGLETPVRADDGGEDTDMDIVHVGSPIICPSRGFEWWHW